jgi:hypothetical protein
MSPETLFSICTRAVLPAWACLIFAPRWTWTARLLVPSVLPPLFAGIYLALAVTHFPRSPDAFGSLAGIGVSFRDPYLALAGWLHFLAFDLFVGAWMVRDAQRQRIPHPAVVPCLLLTFLLGPVGLLLYLAIRAARSRTLVIT